jgi:protein-disulfide isomerase
MHRLALPLAVLMCTVAVSAGQADKPTAEKPALDKSALEAYVRHLFVWGPQIQMKIGDPKPSAVLPGFREVPVLASAGAASQELTFYLSPDGSKIVQGTVYDLKKSPFAADLAKLRTDLQPSFGPAAAPVVIAMFSDFQCSFCREEAQTVRQNIPKEYPEQVRLYFKDYPLESIHPWAKAASIAGHCIFREKPAAFWDYHDWVFEHQGEITAENLKDKVLGFAKTKAIEPIQLNACIDSKATEGEIDRSIAEGRSLGVNSTPTMFVNGRRVVGQVPWQQLKGIIDHEIEYQKKHGGAEKCCEVTLPSPLNK